jgi:hypothetical protein
MAKNPVKTLEKLEKVVDSRVRRILTRNANRIKMKLRADKPLQERSRRRFPYLSRPAAVEGGRLIARVFTPVEWAKVHIGPRGSTERLTPKRGKFLAIPTDFVPRTRGKPRAARYYAEGYKQIFAGIIWARRAGARRSMGLRERRRAGFKIKKADLVPLFILKGSVIIRRRIHPEVYRAWIKPQLTRDLKREVLRVK